ncbi:thiamine biosynthesis lipoprotein [Breoghania corrubedonensis]|uniref:FAD:protein FMN transferase n=1 Tax=Breoghania corrubedonensis TaxID=665038 RepID=A0A2T5V9W2_9HYPH|nr:FAD:protein FMN transferase [Breoghania corrubedonensis]PTW60546.1 thiamine biosynthesis lipoprotein [Breoghania corrubedonensis]
MTHSPILPHVTRRRMLTISAAAAGASLLPSASVARNDFHRWKGIALGANAEVILNHSDRQEAEETLSRVVDDVRRLERIFSLYDTQSELACLNRDGHVLNPAPEFLELLASVRALHEMTDGAFDPTVQPLWGLYARSFSETGRFPRERDIATALECVGFEGVFFDAENIKVARPGMALTLNGVAQGFITDRVSALLKARGYSDVLVNLGEIAALGAGNAGQDGWRVTLQPDRTRRGRPTVLKNRSVATSSLAGMTFDEAGKAFHILDPRTGRPAGTDLSGVSVITDRAAFADGLSTAALIMGERNFRLAVKDRRDIEAFALRTDGTPTEFSA